MDSYRATIQFAAALLMTGCAALPPRGDRAPESPAMDVEVGVDHALPFTGNDREELLRGELRLADSASRIDYAARYVIRSGKVLDAIGSDDGSVDPAAGELAEQVVEQRLSSSLPLPVGKPLRLAVTQRRHSKFAIDGGVVKRSTAAELRWRPAGADLDVSWTPPAEAPAGGPLLDCNLQARIRMPARRVLRAPGSRLELSGQRCSGHAPNRGIDAEPVSRWAAAWHWGADGNSVLRLLGTEQPRHAGSQALPVADYEIGLSHRHVLRGGWEAEADLAILRGDGPALGLDAQAAVTDWTGRIAVSRRLQGFSVTAQAARAPQAAWLATAAKTAATEKFSLALDFGAWLNSIWPRADTDMDLSWNWRERPDGEPDAEVRWDFIVGF